MRKLLRGMRLPTHQWPEAMDHAVMLHNLLSSSLLLNNASPHQLWTGKLGNTKMLRVFGCMIFVELPHGSNADPNQVCQLEKSMYGIKKAPRLWQQHLHARVIRIVYVDDLLYIGSTDDITTWFEGELQRDLTLTVATIMTQYLGLNIQDGDNAIYLSVEKYTDTIAKRFGLTPTAITTPYRYTNRNRKDSALLKPAGIRDYQRKLGCLLFAAVTCRPDLSVKLLCYTAPPTELRRSAEPRRPTETRRPTEPHCPACTTPAATATSAATAATAATATMASPTVLTFDWTTFARYSSPATAALSRLMLPYLFPDLAAFATVADLITHLRTSDARYRAALPTEFCAKNPPPMYITLYYLVTRLRDFLALVKDHFLSLWPTELTVDLLEERLAASEKSILAVGAATARERGARVVEGMAWTAAEAVEEAEGVAVEVGVVPGVGASVAAVEVVKAAAEVVEAAAEVVEAAAAVVEAAAAVAEVAVAVVLVEVQPHSVEALVVASTSSRRVPVRPRRPSSFVSGTLGVGGLGVLVLALTFFALAVVVGRRAGCHTLRSAALVAYQTPGAPSFLTLLSSLAGVISLVPPDPGIEAAALGASPFAAPGTGESAALGAGESALSGSAPTEAMHTLTLDSGSSRSIFRDITTLTPLSRPVPVSLADPSGGPILAHSSTVLPCLAAPLGLLSGLHLPSFSTNLVSGADLQDAWVDQFTPGGQRVTHCTCSLTGRHLATFTHRPGSNLYTLTTTSPPVSASGQEATSSQVFAAASRSSPASAPCSCHPLSHKTLLWHHHLGHPSLPRLQGMASRTLVSRLPRSLPPLPLGPASTCVPCVEGQQRAALHSSTFPPTGAPLQTLHMDVWGPARVREQGHERYFQLVVDDYSRYTTLFPLRSKGQVPEVLIDWIRGARRQLSEHFVSDLPVLRVHSDKGGEFCSDLLRAFCRYAAHQINLQPRVSFPETTPTLRWTGKVGDASAFRVWGSRAFFCDTSADKLSSCAGPAPLGVSQVDPAEPVEVAVDSGAARGAEPAGAGTGAAGPGGAEPERVHSQLQLQPASPMPGPSPYSGPTRGLTERREPESRHVSPESRPVSLESCSESPVHTVRAGRRVSRPRPSPIPGTHYMTMCPSTAPQHVPLPSPPASSLPDGLDPESDSLRADSPTVTRFLATAVTDPFFESTAALVAESSSASVRPPSVGGECALGTDVLEDRQEEFECFAAAIPHLVSMLLASEEDSDAPDIPTPCSYAEAIEGPYSSQWQAAMDAEMASSKSTGTYVNEVPPPAANIVSGMWIFRVKRPPCSPPIFKARYVARGFTFLQGSLHEEIWLRRPPGFTGSFPSGTQWSLRRPVYGLRQAPREWHDTLRTTLPTLGFAPSTADPSLFLRTDTTLPLFYVLVYVDDLVFATADTEALAYVKCELQKRHTCTDLGELTSSLGLRITCDRAQRTITLTQSHMVEQVLQRFGFTYSSPQSTPLPTGHSLSAPPSDESVEPSGPYPELVGCLITSGMGLMLGGRARVVLTCHADASWVDDLATQRSSQGYTFSLGSGSVSWWSTRSSSVLSSSCEAEIYTGAMAAQELCLLTYLLTDLGEAPRSPPVLYVDNKAMLALCQEHRLEH
ncbi:unnamed protein product [Closterium sp. NIES-54]